VAEATNRSTTARYEAKKAWAGGVKLVDGVYHRPLPAIGLAS